MVMKQARVGLVLSLLCAASPAAAGDGWSGFYAGVDLGSGTSTASMAGGSIIVPVGGLIVMGLGEEPEGGLPMAKSAGSQPGSGRGFSGGAFVGRDWQFGAAVIGAVADFTAVGGADVTFSGGESFDTGWVATARVRAGWAVSEKTLVYATAGAATAGINMETVSGLAIVRTSLTKTGYAAGVGIEQKLFSNWSAKIEYLRHDFGTVKDSASGTDFKSRLDTFKIGLSYRF